MSNPELSKIRLKGTVYNFLDKVSRNSLSQLSSLLENYGILETQPSTVKNNFVLVKTATGAQWKKVTFSGGSGSSYSAITAFSASVSQLENGSKSDVKLTWTIDADVTVESLKLNSTALTTTVRTKTYSDVSATTTYTLTCVADGETYTKSVTVSVLDSIYYGAASSFTTGTALATSVLASSLSRTITVNAGSGEYIWFCAPATFGTPTFTVNGFSGGFDLYATKNLTNASGKSVSYKIYKSQNASLGSTTIIIS